MEKTEVKIKTTILPNAPVKFKKEIGKLLTQLMSDYQVHGDEDN